MRQFYGIKQELFLVHTNVGLIQEISLNWIAIIVDVFLT